MYTVEKLRSSNHFLNGMPDPRNNSISRNVVNGTQIGSVVLNSPY